MNFPTHEFRLFLAALLKWALDYPPKPPSGGIFKFGPQRPIKKD